MQEMMLAGRFKNLLGPPIASDWRIAVKLTFNKGLTNVLQFKGTAFLTDIRVYVNDTVLISEVPGSTATTGKAFTIPVTTGVTSVTVWTKPASGANSYNSVYGLEVMCNGMPTGVSVTQASGIDVAEVRRLWISYANGLLTVPNKLSPLIWHIRFYGASTFNSPNVVNWDTSNLTSMNNLFYSANKFNQDISGWNTSKVTDMAGLFYANFEYNKTIKDWDVTKVNSISNMFERASVFNQDLSSMVFKSTVARLDYDTSATAWNVAYRPQFTG